MDYQDLKQFLCNITAPITYIMIMNNGEFKPIRGLLQRLKKNLEVHMNKNLFISDHPENIGYAAALNEAIRHVLTYSVKEIPWIFVSNVDVRFGDTFMPEFVNVVNRHTTGQEIRLQRLKDEIAEEWKTAANAPNRRYLYRSDKRPIVTAPSLPYRIRIMPYSEMRKQFADIYGMFFANSIPHMATTALPRLMLETVGFFDENYYPTYSEDDDYAWRMHALGFRDYFSPKGRYVHFDMTNTFFNSDIRENGIAKYPAYTVQALKYTRVHYRPYRHYYRRYKWFPYSKYLSPEDGPERIDLPFKGVIPVDMWVLDPKHLTSILQIGEGKLCRRHYSRYDMNVLNFNVSENGEIIRVNP
ncbi:beta galactofuranosyl transferase [Leptomonas seymouri]|uniref:Beta galactofuranosyl transferase n=1 Tax=Leptomonas seymouri TaxID=5684 RepID=A0A0N0P269_LEPSE|nr:beta galactofuranosyl transferase [Leptomonas seymouri]|eukprot:KPI82609.1 beta galactofuranosyl transferase [Leptomonas seymouri]